MDTSKDYYATLGVLPTAEDYIIQAAYKALCKRFHPDIYKGADAHDKMAAINEAYEVLGDASKRAEYDRRRGEKTTDDSDFFNDDFDTDQQSVDPFEEDWKVAVKYYPEVDAISKRLAKTSARLAFAFRAYMLEKKDYDNADEIAEVMKNGFLTQFFGSDKLVHAFAKKLIGIASRKKVLRELNKAVKVLGEGTASEKIINQLCSEFKLPKSYNVVQQEKERQERQERKREAEQKRTATKHNAKRKAELQAAKRAEEWRANLDAARKARKKEDEPFGCWFLVLGAILFFGIFAALNELLTKGFF
jgi:curved DNA-binding protein CbpA